MTRILLTLLAVLFLAGPTSAGAGPEPATAIVNVSVVAMDSPRVSAAQTVVVRGGMIVAVGPAASTPFPRGARVIDGSGRWLIPGLADMHTHVDNPEDFPLLLASGVTTTLNMGGSSEDYRRRIRPAIRSGRLPGPYPLTALMIDGPGDPGGSAVVPRNEAEARAAVRSARAAGYDYIKIYSRLQPLLFEAVMDEARRRRFPVVGHVVRSVGLEKGLARGQTMIAHSEEFLTVFDDAPPDPARIPELVALAVRYRVTVTANIFGLATIAEQWGRPQMVDHYLASPGGLALRPALRDRWRSAAYGRLDGAYTAEARFCEQLTAALHAAGVPILVGSDTPDIPGVSPGRSALSEIRALAAVGISNFDALSSATRVPGEFVARTLPGAERFGLIARGYRGDLVMLTSNPLESLDALDRPAGVMVRGRWLPAER